jgi:hypothetical protein
MKMQAITTKYLGPSNVRGSRVKAFAEASSITLNWDHRLNAEGNHQAAAEALANKLGWHGKWFGAGLPNQDMVFVCTGLASHPNFKVSRKPEGGWKPEEIADYDAKMNERIPYPQGWEFAG